LWVTFRLGFVALGFEVFVDVSVELLFRIEGRRPISEVSIASVHVNNATSAPPRIRAMPER
jgi:hypothetical protein